ncbi:MAG: DUF4199 domain-containing protein [Gammaproteobacteria bacterium]|nr:DUF4199 domain-containing protein [Gammaproteobacteria bacterium]
MKKIIIIYGIIAGLVIVVPITLSIQYGNGSIWFGYLIIFIAFSAIYVATRQYRDHYLGGIIDFKIALQVGLGITAVAGVLYTLVWEVYLAFTDFRFIEDYAQAIIANARNSSASEAEIAATKQQVEAFKTQYRNPLIRLPQTLIEILPPGIIVSLFSAAVLRNHRSIKASK